MTIGIFSSKTRGRRRRYKTSTAKDQKDLNFVFGS
jgi:hypothetical protein